jgi:predicted nucleotidyltransferase
MLYSIFPDVKSMPFSREILDDVVRRLVDALRPERIVLFGSRAWGHPRDDSDVDLFVIVPHSALSPAERATRAYRSLRGIDMPKDIIVKTREEYDRNRSLESSLEHRIETEGIVLYG